MSTSAGSACTPTGLSECCSGRAPVWQYLAPVWQYLAPVCSCWIDVCKALDSMNVLLCHLSAFLACHRLACGLDEGVDEGVEWALLPLL